MELEKNLTIINDWMIVIDQAIPELICDQLIKQTKNHLKPSGLLGDYIQNYRTSSDYFVKENTALTKLFEDVVVEFTSLPSENQEQLSVIKYSVGQEYKEHYDFLHHLKNETEKSGDRLFSVIFYLNDDFAGGETYFPKIDIAIVPKKGRALVWKNYIKDAPNEESLHCGLPISQGEKWIATKWVRECKFL